MYNNYYLWACSSVGRASRSQREGHRFDPGQVHQFGPIKFYFIYERRKAMATIKCPKCGAQFTVDESDYQEIVNQVRKEVVHAELESQKAVLEAEAKIAVNEAVSKKEKEISELKEVIAGLKTDIKNKDNEQELIVRKALLEKENEIVKLNGELQMKEKERIAEVSNLKEKHQNEIKQKNEEVAFYKDLKAKMSTKAIGESLEQYCMNEFNKLRTTAFPQAYFEKDNQVSKETGSKGDFIFKDYIDGQEYLSIMFEMKNENDTTATKHKNEDFFKELDKDRNEKGCEYAVLVSLLESENDYYNAGIVDVSYRYPKMYVVRPQCFLTIISILANAAKNSVDYQKQLVEVKNQNIDITHFEEDLAMYKDNFTRNVEIAKGKFDKSIEEIDKTIDHLQKVKEALIGSGNQLRIANEKVQEITIKKLTRNNPTMKEKFDELKK